MTTYCIEFKGKRSSRILYQSRERGRFAASYPEFSTTKKSPIRSERCECEIYDCKRTLQAASPVEFLAPKQPCLSALYCVTNVPPSVPRGGLSPGQQHIAWGTIDLLRWRFFIIFFFLLPKMDCVLDLSIIMKRRRQQEEERSLVPFSRLGEFSRRRKTV